MLPMYCCMLVFPPAGLGVAALLPQPARRPLRTVLLDARHHPPEVLAPAHARETERRPPQPQVEEPPPERRVVEVMLLGRGRRQQLDLSLVEPQVAVELSALRRAGLGVGQEELGLTRLHDDGALGAALHVR